MIIIPFLNGYNWEYTQHFQTNPFLFLFYWTTAAVAAFMEIPMEICLRLTTMVARQAVATDPSKAAIEAMNALKNLAATGREP